jgi:hypothetical protein
MDEDELGGEVFDAEDLDRLAEEREVSNMGHGALTSGMPPHPVRPHPSHL